MRRDPRCAVWRLSVARSIGQGLDSSLKRFWLFVYTRISPYGQSLVTRNAGRTTAVYKDVDVYITDLRLHFRFVSVIHYMRRIWIPG